MIKVRSSKMFNGFYFVVRGDTIQVCKKLFVDMSNIRTTFFKPREVKISGFPLKWRDMIIAGDINLSRIADYMLITNILNSIKLEPKTSIVELSSILFKENIKALMGEKSCTEKELLRLFGEKQLKEMRGYFHSPYSLMGSKL